MSGLRLDAPSALDYFASLVGEDDGFALLEAAISIAQDEEPDLDVQQVLMQVDTLALRLRQRIPADAPPLQRLRLLNRYFFQELGFGGNVNNYYDVRNSYVHEVLQTRRGIPITLSLLYMELAQHIGLIARGVGFPGHFLVKLRLPRGEVIIDPFNGMSVSREELEERLGPYRKRRGLVGDFDAPLGLFLQSATARDILARVLRNLKEIHRSAEDFTRLLDIQQRLVILLPQAWEERRDRGLVLAELGADELAAQDLELYLEHCGSADDAAALFARLAELRKGRRPLH